MFASGSPVCPGIARRLASICYEGLLLTGVLVVTLLVPHALAGAFALRAASAPFLWGHLFIVLLGYFVFFWSKGGQTLAMKTWHIRLTTCTGAPIRPRQALLRYVLCWPSLGLFGVGIVWALVDRDGQFLHDRLAGTQLVRS